MFPFCRPYQANGTSTETALLPVPPERDATDREGKPQTGPLPGKTKREHLPDHASAAAAAFLPTSSLNRCRQNKHRPPDTAHTAIRPPTPQPRDLPTAVLSRRRITEDRPQKSTANHHGNRTLGPFQVRLSCLPTKA